MLHKVLLVVYSSPIEAVPEATVPSPIDPPIEACPGASGFALGF